MPQKIDYEAIEARRSATVEEIMADERLTDTQKWYMKTAWERGVCFPEIDKVIAADPYTTIKFKDGTSATVKCNTELGDKYDLENGILRAFFKRMFSKVTIKTGVAGDGANGALEHLVRSAIDPKKIAECFAKGKERIRTRNLEKQKEIMTKAAERRAKKRPNIYDLVRQLGEKVDRLQSQLDGKA